MDETTFKLFENFDFENNKHFQSGWSSIEKLINPQLRGSEYLRAQAFFFSRNVRTFDYQQYLQWRDRKQKVLVRSEVDEKELIGKLDCNASDVQNDDDQEKHQGVNSLSLAEVAELIQNNKAIPGIVAIDVKPSNTDPTPSKLTRKLKPWEVTESDNEAHEPPQPSTTGDFTNVIT